MYTDKTRCVRSSKTKRYADALQHHIQTQAAQTITSP